MALVCPSGHPPGVGTQFCRLCGRAYVEAADLPAGSQLAMMVSHREALDQVRAAVAPAAALPVPQSPPTAAPGQGSSYAPVEGTAPGPHPTPGAGARPVGQSPQMVPPPPGAPPARTSPPPQGAPLVPTQPMPAAAPAPPPMPAAPPATPPVAGGVHIQMPLVPAAFAPPVESARHLDPTVTDAAPLAGQPVEAADSAVPVEASRRDRGVVWVATLAGFVGGAISGAGVQYLLG